MTSQPTEIVSSRRDLLPGQIVEGRVIISKKTITEPDASKRRQGIWHYTVIKEVSVKPPTKTTKKSKKKDPGFTRVDMGSMESVSGTPMVTIRSMTRLG